MKNKYTVKETIAYELKRRVDFASQEAFFRGAMARMITDDTIEELNRDNDIACGVLFTCGYCASKMRSCERNCPLEYKYQRALREIKLGLRGAELKEEVENFLAEEQN